MTLRSKEIREERESRKDHQSSLDSLFMAINQDMCSLACFQKQVVRRSKFVDKR